MLHRPAFGWATRADEKPALRARYRPARPPHRHYPAARLALASGRSVVFSSSPDALCVSGPITSQPIDASGLAEVAAAVAGGGVPVLINTGFRASQAAELLRHADGAVVGSILKRDGVTWDPARVRELMAAVAAATD